MHRMRSDSHIRWYADGKAEHLPAVVESYGYREDATEAESVATAAEKRWSDLDNGALIDRAEQEG